MTNEQIVIAIQQAGSNKNELLGRLWENNRNFVYKLALRYAAYAEIDDLMQEGYLGLCAAAERYDPERGFLFMSYADEWIQCYIRKYVKNNKMIHIPEYLQADLRRYKSYTASYLQEHGKLPEVENICRELGISPNRFSKLVEQVKMAAAVESLDLPVSDENEESRCAFLPDPENLEEDAVGRIYTADRNAAVWEEVDKLAELRPQVIRLKYCEDLTRDQIGKRLGLTEYQVKLELKYAMHTLRSPLVKNRLRPWCQDIIDTYAYSRGSIWESSTEKTVWKILEREEQIRK